MTDLDLVARLAQEAGFTTGQTALEVTGWAERPSNIAVGEYPVGRTLAKFAALVAAECAKVCEEQEARILSKQDPKAKPGSDSDAVNVNLRMVAVMLPEVADAIRDRFVHSPMRTRVRMGPT
jgi:hypothetical protein